MCPAVPLLVDFVGLSLGPYVETLHEGLDQSVPIRFERRSIVVFENSSLPDIFEKTSDVLSDIHRHDYIGLQ